MSYTEIMNYIALAIYFVAMLLIGYIAYRKTADHSDYMIGGRQLPPFVAALSAGASDSSGWIMMGLPGALYLTGMVEVWICIGLGIGVWLNWLLVAPRLRAYTQVSKDSITLPSYFENRTRDKTRILRIVSGAIILLFFTLYISAGMVSGGVFFESSFGGNYVVGMLLVAGVTLAYTLFGGFLGASFTDVVQGLMMVIALTAIPIAAIFAVGGPAAFVEEVIAIDPNHFSLVGEGWGSSTLIAILSGLAWGLGYFGQPHIVIRFMALRTTQEAKSARRIGVAWTFLAMAGAVVTGLAGFAYFNKFGPELANPETVMLVLAQTLLHPLVSGLILAAVLAAIMSTVSSQMIVCSSALVEDLFRVATKRTLSSKTLLVFGRVGVLIVSIIAALLAINPSDTILGLVSFAWAGFGAAFGPIVLLSLYWRKLTNWGALAAMVVGAVTVFAWSAAEGGIFELYELLPGFVFAMIAAWLVSLATYKRNEEIEDEFTRTGTLVVPMQK